MAANEATNLAQAREATPKINWDSSQMKSSYANVCNATGTREEVVLYFGISSPGQQDAGPEVQVQLSDRVILSPFAAKRLVQLLGNVVGEYERRFGPLPMGADGSDGAVTSKS